MYFQILKLIVFPKSEHFAPQVVEFKPGKLNVITGSSRTGKSAIIPIIDYCLASSDCHIPIDTIRDHASWYGVVFQTDNEQLLLARPVPDGNQASDKFYQIRGTTVSVPSKITEANETRAGVKNTLNSLSGVPSFNLHGTDENIAYQARLGFRDLMALNFQTQGIVANQNILFYKTHEHAHRMKLRNWFPYILGAVNSETLAARQKLEIASNILQRKQRELEKIQKISSAWVANMYGHLQVAKDYGLIPDDFSLESSSEELIDIARTVVEEIPNYSKTSSKDINASNIEMITFEKAESELSNKISAIKKRLSDLAKLKRGLHEYAGSSRKRVDRLQISSWLSDVANEADQCPACGSGDHPSAHAELKKIATVFAECEESASTFADVPDSFEREENWLNIELTKLLEEKNAHQSRYDQVLAQNKQARETFQNQKNMFLFLGQLQSALETFEGLAEGGELLSEIDALKEQIKNLSKLVDEDGIGRRMAKATSLISQSILTYLKMLDVEEKYKKEAPSFNTRDLNISVSSTDGHRHYLSEVGSASNWVSFHLALMCSLQEFFLSLQNSPVPSFVIFDQPSQVYFPKLDRGQKLADKADYKDEDEEAVKSMFKAISRSIRKSDGKWQGIILDHADKGIYGDIEGVFEVDEWRDGNKLIPEEWYQ